MGKTFSTTKRDLKEWDGDVREAVWKLTRHPNSKKKIKGSLLDRHTFGSPEHKYRLSEKREKRLQSHRDRNFRKQEANELINEEQESTGDFEPVS